MRTQTICPVFLAKHMRVCSEGFTRDMKGHAVFSTRYHTLKDATAVVGNWFTSCKFKTADF